MQEDKEKLHPVISMVDNLECTYSVKQLIEVLKELNPDLPVVINDDDPLIMIVQDVHELNGRFYSLNSKSYFEGSIYEIKSRHGVKEFV